MADNAPSIGSAAELFMEKKPGKDKSAAGYASSSDEDDDYDDANDENVQNFQYCKLSDSPPPKKSGGNAGAIGDATPVRKGRGLFTRSNSASNARTKVPTQQKIAPHTPDRLKSPNRIKTKTQRPKYSPSSSLPVQHLKRSSSGGPVDVDSFIGEEEMDRGMTNKSATSSSYPIRRNSRNESTSGSASNNEKQLPPELKGRIHALTFDEEENDHLDSSCESNQTGDNSSSLDCASVKNVGNENSPVKKSNTSTKGVDPALFSTRNLGDMNTPMRMIKKELADQEPEFTFSISEEDLFGSDADSLGATTWLLNEGAEGAANEAGAVNQLEKRRWELDNLQADIERDERSMVAVGGEDISGGPVHVKNMKFRKKVKDQMKNRFHSMVSKKKSKETGSTNHKVPKSNVVAHNRIDRTKLKRDQSGLSITPLTGLEDCARIRMGKYRKDKKLAQEVERRKDRERQDIQKRHEENQQKLLLEKQRRQRLRDVSKWKSAANGESNVSSNNAVAIPDSLERLENRKKLEKWMMGATDCNGVPCESGENPSQEEGTNPRRYLPSSYDGNPLVKTRSTCTKSTCPVDNTTTKKLSLQNGTFDFDAQFPDEDSMAETPEAADPTTHDFACVLCKTGERTHLAVPCMHFSFCSRCVSELEKNATSGMVCSVCNEKVTKFSKVFY